MSNIYITEPPTNGKVDRVSTIKIGFIISNSSASNRRYYTQPNIYDQIE